MKIIYNSIIPLRGFTAINLCGTVFARKEYRPLSARVLRPEACHTIQMQRDGILYFYTRYLLEYLYNLFRYRNPRTAYRTISYEREAYAQQ